MISYAKLFVEFFFGLSMFVNAILFVPQILRLFKTKNPVGLSLTTFIGFNAIQIFSILHGYIHNDYIFMSGMLLSLLLCGCISLLIILYKFRRNRIKM